LYPTGLARLTTGPSAAPWLELTVELPGAAETVFLEDRAEVETVADGEGSALADAMATATRLGVELGSAVELGTAAEAAAVRVELDEPDVSVVSVRPPPASTQALMMTPRRHARFIRGNVASAAYLSG
jgi:hypothetical protein